MVKRFIKKNYGLLAFVCGLVGGLTFVFIVPSVLALILSALCRRDRAGRPRRELVFAKIAMFMGAFSLGFGVLALICSIWQGGELAGYIAGMSLFVVSFGSIFAFEIASSPRKKKAPRVEPEKKPECPKPVFREPESSFVIVPLVSPGHSGETEFGFYLEFRDDAWFVAEHYAYAEPGGSTRYGLGRVKAVPSDIASRGDYSGLIGFVRDNFASWLEEADVKPEYVEAIRAVFVREFRKLEVTDHQPDMIFFCPLCQTDMVSWEYIEYVGIDVRNGRPYFCRSEVRHVGGAYGSQEYFCPISYGELSARAARAGCDRDLSGLSEDNWKSFVPESKWKEVAKYTALKPRELKRAVPQKMTVNGFFMEVHNGHYHNVCWFRNTSSGYRAFSIHASGWSYGLHFQVLPREDEIDLIFSGKRGNSFNAYDCVLSKDEALAVMAFAESLVNTGRPLQAYAKGWYTANGKVYDLDDAKWDLLRWALDDISKNGCILKDDTHSPKEK